MLKHSSLYYTFNYSGSYFTTISYDVDYLLLNSLIYQLSPVLIYSYKTANITIIPNDIIACSNIYNVLVQSWYENENPLQYPSNLQIIILTIFEYLIIRLRIQCFKKQCNINNREYNFQWINWMVYYKLYQFQIRLYLQYFQSHKLGSQQDQLLTKIVCIQLINIMPLIEQDSTNFSLQILNLTSKGEMIKASNKKDYTNICNQFNSIIALNFLLRNNIAKELDNLIRQYDQLNTNQSVFPSKFNTLGGYFIHL